MNFWQGRKVLLTGHTGFKGGWLSLWLQSLGAEVIGFALNPPTTPNLFTLADVARDMTSIIGDVRDFEQVLQVVKTYAPEIVIHMAAQPLVRYAYQAPLETYQTNVMGTVHVVEAARLSDSVKTILNVTTDKCYQNQEWHWGYRESDPLGGYDPYSNSKACSELVTDAYRNSFFSASGIGIASARAGNVIGGGDWALDRLVPDIVRACINQTLITIRNPHALRPWQHVLEPLSGYLLLAEKLHQNPTDYAGAWNFGPNPHDVKSVEWITEYITGHWGNRVRWESDIRESVHEAMTLKLDCAKANAQLGWMPRWNLERGLSETIQWYKGFERQTNCRELTYQQIKRFAAESVSASCIQV